MKFLTLFLLCIACDPRAPAPNPPDHVPQGLGPSRPTCVTSPAPTGSFAVTKYEAHPFITTPAGYQPPYTLGQIETELDVYEATNGDVTLHCCSSGAMDRITSITFVNGFQGHSGLLNAGISGCRMPGLDAESNLTLYPPMALAQPCDPAVQLCTLPAHGTMTSPSPQNYALDIGLCPLGGWPCAIPPGAL